MIELYRIVYYTLVIHTCIMLFGKPHILPLSDNSHSAGKEALSASHQTNGRWHQSWGSVQSGYPESLGQRLEFKTQRCHLAYVATWHLLMEILSPTSFLRLPQFSQHYFERCSKWSSFIFCTSHECARFSFAHPFLMIVGYYQLKDSHDAT